MSIKMIVIDVDGTLTDGRIYFSLEGEFMKAFDVRDGYAITHILPSYGIIPVVITGRKSKIVEQRAKELKIVELYQGVNNKQCQLLEVVNKYNFSINEIAYIGDDLNDLPCIECCGLAACPNDAVNEVKEKVDYVCNLNGGRGAVREFIEWIIKNN